MLGSRPVTSIELPDTKVLIFSLLSVVARAREAQADAFLRKPLAEQTLVQTVGRLLAIERVNA